MRKGPRREKPDLIVIEQEREVAATEDHAAYVKRTRQVMNPLRLAKKMNRKEKGLSARGMKRLRRKARDLVAEREAARQARVRAVVRQQERGG